MGYIRNIFPNNFTFWVVVHVTLGATATGYALSILGSTIGQPSLYTALKLAPPGEPGYDRTTQLIGAVNGLSSAGAALGALYNAWSADKFSRKYTIQMAALVLVLGAGLGAGAVNIGMLMAARFISGWGTGMMISVIPIYLSEISISENRGFIVSMYGVMGAGGYTLSSWIGLGFYYVSASDPTATFAWRLPLAFQALFPILLLLGSPWIPFSPRWLMEKGKFIDAERVFQRLHTRKGAENHDLAKKEFIQLQKQLELDNEARQNRSVFDIVRTHSNRKRLIVVLILTWGSTFTGPLVIANYAIIILSELGTSGAELIILLGVWTSFTIPGNIISAFLVDRVGRRKLLLTGTFSLLVTLICECALQATYVGSTNAAGKRAAIFFFYLYIVIYTICLDVTQWVYLSELFPTHVRSTGVGIGFFNWFGSSIILLVAGPTALKRIGWKLFFVLIAPTALFAVGVYFLFPETAEKSLEDINADFGERVAVRYHGAEVEDDEKYQTTITTDASCKSNAVDAVFEGV